MKNKIVYEEEFNDFDEFDDELLNLGEKYEELNNIISNIKDRGVVNVSEILCEVDFLREATHRNTKKATIYATYKNHQNKLKRLAKNNPSMVKSAGNRGKLVRNYVKKNDYKNKSIYNRKALRKELKDISLDIPSGNFYKNIRGREKSFSKKNLSNEHHICLKNKNLIMPKSEAEIILAIFNLAEENNKNCFYEIAYNAS